MDVDEDDGVKEMDIDEIPGLEDMQMPSDEDEDEPDQQWKLYCRLESQG
jgi:hypothetical protein